MPRIFLAALVYSGLIELESAYFKGAITTLVHGHLHWWPFLVTGITVFGFAATIAHLIKRLERNDKTSRRESSSYRCCSCLDYPIRLGSTEIG